MALRANGTQRPKIGTKGPYGKTMKPVGSEYVGKDGVIMVKVAEWPSKPGSKDNWVQKQRYVWEQANNQKLPSGKEVIVIFCDHDNRNFDPDNLLAVPRRYIARMNSIGQWSDKQTAEAVLAAAMVEVKANDVERNMLVCNRCGKTFVFDRKNCKTLKRFPKLYPECQQRFKQQHGRAK